MSMVSWVVVMVWGVCGDVCEYVEGGEVGVVEMSGMSGYDTNDLVCVPL